MQLSKEIISVRSSKWKKNLELFRNSISALPTQYVIPELVVSPRQLSSEQVSFCHLDHETDNSAVPRWTKEYFGVTHMENIEKGGPIRQITISKLSGSVCTLVIYGPKGFTGIVEKLFETVDKAKEYATQKFFEMGGKLLTNKDEQ